MFSFLHRSRYRIGPVKERGADGYRLSDLRANCSFVILPGFANKVSSFKVGDRELLYFTQPEASGGIEIMYPFIDRVAKSRFTFKGKTHRLDSEELLRKGLTRKGKRGPVYHGMAQGLPWKVEKTGWGFGGAYIRCRLDNRDYPEIAACFGPGWIQATYRLQGHTLSCSISIHNASIASTGSHPWFARGKGDWRVSIPAGATLGVGADMIPTGERFPIDESRRKFSLNRKQHIIFTGLKRRGEFATTRIYNTSDGTLITVRQSRGLPFIVLWDRVKDAFALEPVSSPPDALNDCDNRRRLLPILKQHYQAKVSYRVERGYQGRLFY